MVKRKNTSASGNPIKKQSRVVKSVKTKKSTSSKKISTESQRCLTAEDANFDIISWVGFFRRNIFFFGFLASSGYPQVGQ